MNHIASDLRLSRMPAKPLVADMSLALINRTGAYHVCQAIAEGCADLIAARRFWRLRLPQAPAGALRRILAKLMVLEIDHPRISACLPGRRSSNESVLYMDPLYVLGEAPGPDDIVLCHDLGPVTHPDLFGASTERSYRRAYEIIRRCRPGLVFVSAASRDAFVAAYGNAYPLLEVIPLFVRGAIEAGECRPLPGISSPFLLTVGALERRKNHLRVFEAFARSGLAAQGYSYVFCGPPGNAADDVIAAASRTPGVVRLGYVADAELAWLYRNASAFVLPSLLEGFGVPALEAAQHGLPSIVGKGGAQQEAVGQGAIFVDETSVDDIAEGLQRLAAMPPDERSRLVDTARAHALSLSRERFVASWRALIEARRS